MRRRSVSTQELLRVRAALSEDYELRDFEVDAGPKMLRITAPVVDRSSLTRGIERSTRHKNTQPYDRIILPIYFVFAFATFTVASLDGGRFHWSGDVSIIWVVLAYIFYLLGNSLAGWAINSNPFFSSESRLQKERAQKVASTGPYRFIRHPAYSAAFLLWITTGLMLASWWAVIPGLLAGVMMIIRTFFEDRMLMAELPGYVDYARQVKYRLLPGVW